MNKCAWLLLLIAGCSEDSLHKACPIDCVGIDGQYSEAAEASLRNKMGVGACRVGKPTCDDSKNIIACDAVLPSKEICDGIDNDCDGLVDEYIYAVASTEFSKRYPEETNPCGGTVGECAKPLIVCDKGWQCDDNYVKNIVIREDDSRCDGLDNDCDGEIDEDYPSSGCFGSWPQEEFWRFTQAECRPGVELCIDGGVQCVGLREPQPEVCNQLDDDCNGVVDDTDTFIKLTHDVVIIVDRSGSMASRIQPILWALDSYVEQFTGLPNTRFALVDITNTTDLNGDGLLYGPDLVAKIVDFSSLEDIRNAISSLTSSGAGTEASLDGMLAVCDVSNNPLELSWADNSDKILLLFTDETCQTYYEPPTLDTEVIDTCLSSGVLPAIWANSNGDGVCFRNIADATNGLWFPLIADWTEILANLNSMIITLCED